MTMIDERNELEQRRVEAAVHGDPLDHPTERHGSLTM
jgi:hypothetical protein